MRPHAATSIGANYSYTYDANGNMLTRREGAVTYTQTWDEENRLKTISTTGHTVTYTYDADGQRVKKVEDGQTTVYLGNAYEKNVTANTVTTYYYAGPQRIAQRQAGVVSYFVGDNLGSTSLTTDATGAEVGRQKYFPFGAPRVQSGNLKTDFRFTGQRSEEINFGSLYDYSARFYSPLLGKFLSPDTIIPAPGHPQSLNRYAYTANNPLRYTDPTGHWLESALDIAFIIYDIHDIAVNGLNLTSGLSLVADVAGLALPAVTGGGLLVRGIAHADDVAKAVSHVDDIAKAATHADELVKAAAKADDAAKVVSHADEPTKASLNIADNIKRLPNDELNAPIKRGNAPTSKIDKKPIAIHHEAKNKNGPFREMTWQDHRGAGNDKVNHPQKSQPSKIDR